MIELLEAITNIVFVSFAVYGIFILRTWHKISAKTEKMLEQMEEEIGRADHETD